MRKTAIIIISAFSIIFASKTTLAIESPIAGSGTVPPSTPSGLIPSVNPIDTSGNLSITGNIRRGRHFRGVVPYRSSTDFSDTLPSSDLDTFLRDSAGSEDFGRYTNKYQTQPYYSQSRTVTSFMPNYPRVFRPSNIGVGGNILSEPLPTQSQQQLGYGTYDATPYNKMRPLAPKTYELQRTVTSEIEKYLQKTKYVQEVDQQQTEEVDQFKNDLEKLREKASQLKQKLLIQDQPDEPTTKKDSEELLNQTLETEVQPEKPQDVYDKMKQLIETFQKKDSKSDNAAEKKSSILETIPPKKSSDEILKEKLDQVEAAALSAKAKEIMGKHKTFASFADDKFNQHMRAAEQLLKMGKYYRAADAFTLASLYKPSDPLAFAGKSHALFAAGEYMSSALFLARALEIFPEYATFKIDIVAMVGDKDKLETRIAEVEEWIKKKDTGELHFLIAYVYYQIGRINEAKDSIYSANYNIPDSIAVSALKKVIDQAK